MTQKMCECGKSRSGATEKKIRERVGKPTAWGHVHERIRYTYTCNDCGLTCPDLRTRLAMQMFAPPNDQ